MTDDELFLMAVLLIVIGVITALARLSKVAITALAIAIVFLVIAISTQGHPKDGYTADQMEHHFMVLDIFGVTQDNHDWEECPGSWEEFQNWKKNH